MVSHYLWFSVLLSKVQNVPIIMSEIVGYIFFKNLGHVFGNFDFLSDFHIEKHLLHFCFFLYSSGVNDTMLPLIRYASRFFRSTSQ